MKLKKIFLSASILLFFGLTAFSQEVSEQLTSLKDVDYISISGYIREGDLFVTIVYKNMESGKLVYWENDKVSAECEVYENIGDTINRKRGQRLATVNKNLTSNKDDLRINIPKMGKDKRGLIYCTINTGYKEVSASGDFWFK